MNTLIVSPTRNLWDIHNLPDFISRSDALEIIPKALVEFEAFVMGCGYEEEWIELEVGDKFFDLNVWDESGGDREGECRATLYATYPTTRNDNLEAEDMAWRETDTSKDWGLFEADVYSKEEDE